MNKQLIFIKRPVGAADASSWSIETNPIPELEEGQVLVKNHYISLDPAMRGWMKILYRTGRNWCCNARRLGG